MFSPKQSRMNRWRVLGSASSVALAGVAIACSSGAPEQRTAEAIASTSEAITAQSCQALDVSTSYTDATNQGSTNFAIDTSGNLVGWGFNDFPNPLGFDNAIAAVSKPTPLGVTNATKVAAHQSGACAITNHSGGAPGTVTCVGQPLGAVALSTFGTTPTPDPDLESCTDYVSSPVLLTGAIGIAAGTAHACIWTASGAAWCWGNDYYGQLGDGSYGQPPDAGASLGGGGAVTNSVAYAVPMLDVYGNPLTDVVQIAAAENTTCVLHRTGAVECVGANGAGELGQGGGAVTAAQTGLLAPINVAPGNALLADDHRRRRRAPDRDGRRHVAVREHEGRERRDVAGDVLAGATTRTADQALISSTNAATAPQPVSSDLNAIWEQGPLNGCEITSAGALLCWGANNSQNATLLGAPASTDVLSETAITGVTGIYKTAIGYGHICALGNAGLWCWGSNRDGEMGNSSAASPVSSAFDVRLSVPALQCPSNGCGAMTNSCGESLNCGDCGGGVESGNDLCVSNSRCQLNPNYCGSAGCGSGNFCSNRTCLSYCATNPISSTSVGTTVTMTQAGFNVTSPAGYSSSNCEGYIVDVTNMPFYYGTRMIVQPSGSIAQADCANTRVSIATYTNGKAVSSIGPFYGVWINSSGFIQSYCSFSGSNYQNELALPYVSTDVRIVASAEQSSVTKGVTSWGTIPVNVYLPEFIH